MSPIDQIMDPRFGYCKDWVSGDRDPIPCSFAPRICDGSEPELCQRRDRRSPHSATRLVLKAFHEERQKSGDSREAEFWRGNFVGMKRAVFAIYGKALKDDVIDRRRRTTNLPIPHRGPLTLAGVPEGFDSDADS